MNIESYKVLSYEDYNKLIKELELVKEEKRELEKEITTLYNIMIGNNETHEMNLQSDIEEI